MEENNKESTQSKDDREYSAEELESFSKICHIRGNEFSPIRRAAPKIKRNEKCPFDSNKKFKKCCGGSGSTHCTKMLLDYLNSINNSI